MKNIRMVKNHNSWSCNCNCGSKLRLMGVFFLDFEFPGNVDLECLQLRLPRKSQDSKGINPGILELSNFGA